MRSPMAQQIIALLLLLAGVQLWLLAAHGYYGRSIVPELILAALVAALLITLIGPARRAVITAFDSLNLPRPWLRRALTVVIALSSSGYFVWTETGQQGFDLLPRIHDESSYLIQTRMLLAGRLWEPEHPLADFFDSFHII